MSFNSNRFIELLRPEYGDALKYCRALCSKRSAEDAEDILQSSFLKAIESFDSLNDECKFRSWLFSIITREFYTFLRKDIWRRFLPFDDKSVFPEMPEVMDRSMEAVFAADIPGALNCLNTKERTALLLFEIGNFSLEEIREIQSERSLSAVKSRLSRARGKLRDHFLNEDKSAKLKSGNEKTEGDLNDETYRLIQQAEGR